MSVETTTHPTLAKWRRMRRWPGGAWLFSRMAGWRIPFTGVIGARVEHFEPGHVRVSMADRRRVRNHLRSLHFGALATLAEYPTGLSLIAALGPGWRFIMVEMHLSFEKKARGRVVAEAHFDPAQAAPEGGARDVPIESVVRDAAGDVVARGRYVWNIRPPTVPPPAA